MKDILMKLPVVLNTGVETSVEDQGTVKKPVQETKELVIRTMSMDEYFESNTLTNKKEIWEYILDKQIVTPVSLKEISAWGNNLAVLKYVVSMSINFTLDPYSERWLPFHTSYEELMAI